MDGSIVRGRLNSSCFTWHNFKSRDKKKKKNVLIALKNKGGNGKRQTPAWTV